MNCLVTGPVGFTGRSGRLGDRGATGWTGRQGYIGGTGLRGFPAAQLGGTFCVVKQAATLLTAM